MRVAISGMSLKVALLTAGSPRQYLGFASSVKWLPFTHSTQRYGPLPTGFWRKPCSPTCLR